MARVLAGDGSGTCAPAGRELPGFTSGCFTCRCFRVCPFWLLSFERIEQQCFDNLFGRGTRALAGCLLLGARWQARGAAGLISPRSPSANDKELPPEAHAVPPCRAAVPCRRSALGFGLGRLGPVRPHRPAMTASGTPGLDRAASGVIVDPLGQRVGGLELAR